MKKYLLYIICFICLTSCGDFLDEYSQDLVVVKTVEDLDEVLLGDVYLPNNAPMAFLSISFVSWLNFLDDDINTVISRRGGDKWLSTKWLYGYTNWLQEIGASVDGSVTIASDGSPWVETYYRINVINVILNELKNIDLDGEADELAALRIQGECHFQRGLFYFFLVNLYAKAYQPESADETLGIPLKLSSYVENEFHRNSLKEVYEQVVTDLTLAVDELTRSPQSNPSFRASRESALLLLSRVYLYMQDWENARKTANEFLQSKNTLVNIASLAADQCFMNKNNEEIIFSQSSQTLVNVVTAEGGDFCVSRNLYNLYDDKDYRKKLYFSKNVSTDSIALNRKYSKKKGEVTPSDGFTMRVAEAYLNMAEACAMLNDAEACDWLNRLRRNRISEYVDMQYSGEELVDEIRNERRKELCLEGHRWFDLRRYAACVKYPFKKEIVRVFAEYSQDNNYKFNTAKLFRLEKDDPAYLFRIPASVREYHEDMPDNERRVRKAFASVDADGNLIENE